MNPKYKLKVRKDKEETTQRRIRTDLSENNRKPIIGLSKPIVSVKHPTLGLNKPRIPLNDNKKILNQTEISKKPKYSKSMLGNNYGSKINTTQHNPKQPLPRQHKQAIDKLFNNQNSKKDKVDQNYSLLCNLKNAKKNQEKVVTSRREQGNYIYEGNIGSGAFGTVQKARSKKTLQYFAIKRVFQDKKYKNRELDIMKLLDHPCILKMHDYFITYEGTNQYLNIVMDYFPCNLHENLSKYRHKGQLPRLKLKVYAYQLIRSLLYLNNLDVVHRDIKPQNILVDDQKWKLILCDFGCAKKLTPGQTNLAYICSRYYRAPELIFGCTNYTTQIDMWSVGCVLAEMVLFKPLFKADSNIDQLIEVIKILGTPTEDQIFTMNPQSDFSSYEFPKIKRKQWHEVFKKDSIEEDFISLLSEILVYDPKSRITPLEALQHEYFAELKDKQTMNRLQKQFKIPDLFNYEQTREISASQMNKLIPEWY